MTCEVCHRAAFFSFDVDDPLCTRCCVETFLCSCDPLWSPGIWVPFALLFLTFTLVGCGLMPHSFRPRGVDVYAEGGTSSYAGERGKDFRTGVSVHFDLEYGDEFEVPKEGPPEE